MRTEKGFVFGLVIGIAIFVFLAGHAHAVSTPSTDNFSVLYNFGGVSNDGANPLGSLTLSGTTFYGMTTGVGDNSDSSGTIFQINADGTGYQVLHNFGNVNNGANPHGDLIISGSTLYGMTLGAGTLLAGTVFKINNDGTGYQVLHDFGTAPNDGYCPFGSLTLLGSTLYGMTPSGGAGGFGLGTIFQVNTDGSGYQVLHSFGIVANDGVYPYDSLTLSGTTLYGMTSGGGAYGTGTIFQINSDGTGYQVLYSFGGVANDGVYPYGSLTLSGTTLYGMTQVGGANGLGTIFQINTDGTGYQVLYSFAGYPNDGSYPTSSLTLSGSTLYGMTAHGGSGDGYGSGTIFQINTSGAGYQVLYDFGSVSSNDGGSLTLSGTTIYGMAYGGGSYDKGTIFSVSETPAVPDAPTGVTAAAGIGQAAVSFTAPAGPPVSYYTVTSNPGGITATGSGGPIIVEGLANGTAYTFTVTATNTIGTGPPSGPSNSVTPYAVPPSYIAALAGTWNANFIVSGSDAPEWERGTVTVNPDETLSNVSITDNNGNPDQVINSGASAFWSSPGGLFLTTGRPNNILCQIDSGNTVIVCTETDLSNGSPGLLIFTKQAASCSLADLTGAWEGNFLTSSGQYSGAAETDSLTIGSNGTWTDSTTGGTGTWPISSSGVITAPSDSTFSGVMDADKTVIVATSGANTGSGGSTSPAVLSVCAKQAASYLPEDLAGTWQGNSLSMWTWERDTLTINQDGTFTMFSTANDGSTNNNTSGTCTLSPYGAITLVVNAGSSQSIISGDMAADKTVMVTTAQSSINDYIEIFTKSAAGALTVTISPASAVSAGAMWNVDGKEWLASGTTVSNMSVGSHTVGFTNVQGWTTPSSQTFNISNGQTNSLSGAYVQQTGASTVTIGPAGAISAGAQWSVDGGNGQASGTTVSGLTVGTHTVTFNNIAGWTTPSSQNVNISNGQTNSLSGAYVQQTGALTVTTSPAGAISAGAQWSVDGGNGQASGTTVSGLTVGTHTVTFNNIAGWNTPSSQNVNISNGQTASVGGAYVQQTGALTVTTSPAGAISAGAQWSVDGGNGQASGTTVSGLTVGTHTVTFNNIAGWTTPSSQNVNISNGQTASVGGAYVQLPASDPGAPTGVLATAGNARATVTFTAPASNGGGAISGYTATSSPGGNTASGATSPITVTGLTNGTAYTFTVVATNARGSGQASKKSNTVTPATVPDEPTGVTPTAGNAQATVSFTAPASNGGSVITGYTVTSSPGGKTGSGTASPITVTGLTNGTSYTFTVTAINQVGPSQVSSPSNKVTPATLPGAPTGATATPGNTQATVSFTAPASNGGSAITSYTVTSSPGGNTASGTASPITVTGLTNETSYTFTVTAKNQVGPSQVSSPSNKVTPAMLPGAPTGATATAGIAQATVSFTAPASNGGSAITSYTVTSSPGGNTASGATSPITVTGLTNETSYTFTVTAKNQVGPSQVSSPSNKVTPAMLPGAPTGATATAGIAQATVSFTAPASNGGSPITSYTVTSIPGGKTASGATSPITVTGLTNLWTAYTFTVEATNAVGTGPASKNSNSVKP